MKIANKTIKKILYSLLGVVGILLLVLVIHIYWVTRPPKANAATVAIARIDFENALNATDSTNISQWLYQQKGIEYVHINTTSKTAVFSYYPIKTNASDVAISLTHQLSYKAKRFMPSEADMKTGCPVGKNNKGMLQQLLSSL